MPLPSPFASVAMPGESVTYCGPAPVPADLAARWNTDPWLLAALAGMAAWWMFAAGRHRAGTQRRAFAAAWALLVVAFVSPLCAATVALFSARAVHHVLLVAAAAPLLVLALAGRGSHAGARASPGPGQGRSAARTAGLPLLVAMGVFYAWHLPPLYAAALGSTAVYWLMQLSLLGSAVWFWAAVLDARTPPHVALPALLAAVVLMGLLGALLTFAPRVLYAAHAVAPLAFGIEPLDDQRLAGLVMWVPALLPYLAFAGWVARRWAGAAGTGA